MNTCVDSHAISLVRRQESKNKFGTGHGQNSFLDILKLK